MKSKVDKLNVDKLKPVPVDLKTLSDLGRKRGIRKDMHDELVKKVNAVQTTDTKDLVKKKLTIMQKLMK